MESFKEQHSFEIEIRYNIWFYHHFWSTECILAQ